MSQKLIGSQKIVSPLHVNDDEHIVASLAIFKMPFTQQHQCSNCTCWFKKIFKSFFLVFPKKKNYRTLSMRKKVEKKKFCVCTFLCRPAAPHFYIFFMHVISREIHVFPNDMDKKENLSISTHVSVLYKLAVEMPLWNFSSIQRKTNVNKTLQPLRGWVPTLQFTPLCPPFALFYVHPTTVLTLTFLHTHTALVRFHLCLYILYIEELRDKLI